MTCSHPGMICDSEGAQIRAYRGVGHAAQDRACYLVFFFDI